MKAGVAALNQEKALVGAFSVIVQLRRLIIYSTSSNSNNNNEAECCGGAAQRIDNRDGAESAIGY